MTRSITGSRRATVLLAGAAAAAAFAVSGCGTGQYAETANKQSSVPGTNKSVSLRSNGQLAGSFSVRNLQIAYNGPKGYQPGASAPLEVHLVNESAEPLTVRVRLAPGAQSAGPQVVEAKDVLLAGGSGSLEASPASTPGGTISPRPGDQRATPSAGATDATADPGASPSPGSSGAADPGQSAAPAAPAGEPATFQIPARSLIVLGASSKQVLEVQGLAGPLRPGNAVLLQFDVEGPGIDKANLSMQAPMAVAMSPAPRATTLSPPHGEGD